MGPTTITLWYPHISPSLLRHGTQVYCYGMCQSRIYTIPYPHLADYMAITLPNGTLWGPQRPNVMVPTHQYTSVMP